MTNDDGDNGWDSLAQEFGLDASTSPPKSEPAAPSKPAVRGGARRPGRDSVPESQEEVDDFGAGVADQPSSPEALYDPGPDAVADDVEEFDDVDSEAMDEPDEGDEQSSAAAGDTEGEGGKRRRRRRRRKKKGGPGAADRETVEPSPHVAAMPQEDDGVEEGEAPAEVENGDDDEPAPPSAVDEEMVAEAAGPRPEWHVMTWMELVSKLYRPS